MTESTDLHIRKRTPAEALAYVAQELREHPEKYSAAQVSILLDVLAEQVDYVWQWRTKGTGDPDGAFTPWRTIDEGRIEFWTPYSSNAEFRKVPRTMAGA